MPAERMKWRRWIFMVCIWVDQSLVLEKGVLHDLMD